MNSVITLPKTMKKYLSVLALGLCIFSASAGEYGSDEEIRREISFLAKKLLDMHKVDEYTLVSEAKLTPYIGICTSMKKRGVVLTCISPGSQASKAGLRTGDIVVSINGKSMRNQHSHMGKKGDKSEKAYWEIIKNMKVGDKFEFEVIRSGELMKIDATVGSLSHPGYTLEIKR